MDELRSKLKEKYGYENVCVIHANDITPLLHEGFNEFNPKTLRLITEKAFFIRRYNAEYNSKFKQVIPYVIFRHGKQLFASRRLSGSGEARLVGNISLGQSGHINDVDGIFGKNNLIMSSVTREIHEELNIYCNTECNAKYIGFLNDNSNQVSQDHLAVLVLVDVSKPNITIRETTKSEGTWRDMVWLRENYNLMESWSQKVFDVLEERMKG